MRWWQFVKFAAAEFTPGTIPAAVLPLWEVSLNYSFFRDRPIVSSQEDSLPAGEQGAERASEFARLAGRHLDISPAYIDHVLYGYTGGLGSNLNRGVLSPLIKWAVPDETRPPRAPARPEDWIVLKHFMAGRTRNEHEALRRFYDEHDRLSDIRRAYGRLDVDAKRQEAYFARHAAELQAWPIAAKGQRILSDLAKRRRFLIVEGQEDPDALDRDLRENERLTIELIREVNEAMDGVGID